MGKQEFITSAEEALLHTYNRFGLVLDKGEGMYLYDTDGKQYLDCAAGIAVCAFGYGKKEYNDALKAQIDKLLHTSNLYYNVPLSWLQRKQPLQLTWIESSSQTQVQRQSKVL